MVTQRDRVLEIGVQCLEILIFNSVTDLLRTEKMFSLQMGSQTVFISKRCLMRSQNMVKCSGQAI